jgi:hypothetical protein
VRIEQYWVASVSCARDLTTPSDRPQPPGIRVELNDYRRDSRHSIIASAPTMTKAIPLTQTGITTP